MQFSSRSLDIRSRRVDINSPEDSALSRLALDDACFLQALACRYINFGLLRCKLFQFSDAPVMTSASALRLWAEQVTHVECFHRSAKAFKCEFAYKFYVCQCLDSAKHININQNLSILSLIAKSGGEIRHLARN